MFRPDMGFWLSCPYYTTPPRFPACCDCGMPRRHAKTQTEMAWRRGGCAQRRRLANAIEQVQAKTHAGQGSTVPARDVPEAVLSTNLSSYNTDNCGAQILLRECALCPADLLSSAALRVGLQPLLLALRRECRGTLLLLAFRRHDFHLLLRHLELLRGALDLHSEATAWS